MNCLADWLADQSPEDITSKLTSRVTAFADWCEAQPRVDTALDDLYTILVVGFYERLFRSDITRVLLPALVPKDDLVDGVEYWKGWVGDEEYDKALALYTPQS